MANLNLTDRHVIRDLIYAGLNTYLTSTNKYLKVFFNYAPSARDIDGQSPIGWIHSGGTGTEQPTTNQRILSDHSFIIQVGIKLGGNSGDDVVEDRLDLINKAIRDWLYHADQRQIADTYQLTDLAPSACGFAEFGGEEYRTEVYQLGVEVKDE